MPTSDADAFAVWAVVKVPFPYTNRPIQQMRPALVVGRYDEPDAPVLLWVLMITSAENRRWAGDVAITDLEAAGLSAPSVVRSAKIATIDAADASTIGHLPVPDRRRVMRQLAARLPGKH